MTEKGRQATEFPLGGSFRRAHSIEEMLNEMSGYISYIEDLNRTNKIKVAPYLEKMRSLAQRLNQISK